VPHIHGFPLLGWQLARAESTSRPAFEPALRGQSEPCVVLETLAARKRPRRNDSQDSLHNSHCLEMRRRNNQRQTRC
jgi:hypothetical protein